MRRRVTEIASLTWRSRGGSDSWWRGAEVRGYSRRLGRPELLRSRLRAGGVEAVPRAAEIVDPQSHMQFCHFLLVALPAGVWERGNLITCHSTLNCCKDAASQHNVTQRSRRSGHLLAKHLLVFTENRLGIRQVCDSGPFLEIFAGVNDAMWPVRHASMHDLPQTVSSRSLAG